MESEPSQSRIRNPRRLSNPLRFTTAIPNAPAIRSQSGCSPPANRIRGQARCRPQLGRTPANELPDMTLPGLEAAAASRFQHRSGHSRREICPSVDKSGLSGAISTNPFHQDKKRGVRCDPKFTTEVETQRRADPRPARMPWRDGRLMETVCTPPSDVNPCLKKLHRSSLGARPAPRSTGNRLATAPARPPDRSPAPFRPSRRSPRR